MTKEFIRVSRVEEAVKLKDADSLFFAGGTELARFGVCMNADNGSCKSMRSCGDQDVKESADRMILLKGIPALQEIREEGDHIVIGSLTTFTQAINSELTPHYLKKALKFMGSFQKRNMATIGGNIGAWRSDSYLVPTLLAAGAELILADRDGERIVSIDEYAKDRDRFSDAMILAVIVSKGKCCGGSVRVQSRRYANTVESHAYLTIAMGMQNGVCRIAMAIKNAGIFTADERSWSIAWKMANVKDDLYGSEAYKRYLTGVTLDDMYEHLLEKENADRNRKDDDCVC